MSNFYTLLISFALTLLTLACSDDRTSVSPNGAGNMITNSSFEDLDGPSTYGWLVNEELAGFDEDVPPGGGGWSLALYHGMPPEWGSARTIITNQAGKHIYCLTSWAKSTGVGGAVYFGKWSGNDWVQEKHVMIPPDANSWTAYKIIDTLDVQVADTLGITLLGYGLEVELGSVLFDLIQLRKLSQ